MKVAKNIHELIGNTPMIEITQFDLPREIRIFAKLEYVNPGGSVKDRLGKELMQEKSGYLLNWNMLIQEEV